MTCPANGGEHRALAVGQGPQQAPRASAAWTRGVSADDAGGRDHAVEHAGRAYAARVEPGRYLILFYDYVADIVGAPRAGHRPAHLDHVGAYKQDGRIVAAGALGDPVTGAAIVFADRRRGRDPDVRRGATRMSSPGS